MGFTVPLVSMEGTQKGAEEAFMHGAPRQTLPNPAALCEN